MVPKYVIMCLFVSVVFTSRLKPLKNECMNVMYKVLTVGHFFHNSAGNLQSPDCQHNFSDLQINVLGALCSIVALLQEGLNPAAGHRSTVNISVLDCLCIVCVS